MKLPLRLYVRPPERLSPSPVEEARHYAKLFARAKTKTRKTKIISSLIVNGSRWDTITRSCMYYNLFEDAVGIRFPVLWGETDSEWVFKRPN